jgi:hypothetical protein
MDIAKVRQLLEGHCARQSAWEFKNFVLEAYGEHQPRAVHDMLVRRRSLDDQIRRTPETEPTLRSNLIAEQQQVDQWLDQWTAEELAQQLEQFEAGEEQYWVERLGREAVVDLMTTGRVGKETMARAVLLSEDNYRRFVEVSGTIGNVINTISREVETAQGHTLPENMPR